MRTLFIAGVFALMILALPGFVVFGADLLGYGTNINDWLDRKFAISHKLAISVPAAVALFCILPLIILLYFLRLKRQPVAVASTFLWKKSVEDLHVNRLMQWLRRNILLLLQILAVLFCIYAVLGPRTNGSNSGGKYYILLIDNSASMSATDVKPTRLDWAKEEALRIIDAHTDSDPGLLIVFNSTAEVRQSYTTNREELKAAVRAVPQTHHQTRIDDALTQAASRANPNRSTENESVAPANQEPGKERTYVATEGFQADVYLLSDGRFPNVPDFPLENLNIHYSEMPSPYKSGTSNNVAITRFSAERDIDEPQLIRVGVTVTNYREKPTDIKVKLDLMPRNEEGSIGFTKTEKIPATVLDTAERNARLKPGESTLEFLVPEVPENSDVILRATLVHDGDIFPLDDTAWVVLGVMRKANVLVVTPGNKFLRFLFDAKDSIKRANFTYITPAELNDPKEYLTPARDGKYDLVIFDRCGPASEDQMPNANTFFIGYPPPPYKPATATGDPMAVTMVKNPNVRSWLGRHTLTQNLRDSDQIYVAEAFKFPSLPPRTPRLLEGDNDLVLMTAFSRLSFTDITLTFTIVESGVDGPDSVHNTNWNLRPSFVLFLRNLVTQFGGVLDSSMEAAIRPGQVVAIRPGTAKQVVITKPGARFGDTFDRGSRPEIHYTHTDTLGVYSADWGQIRRFAVNLQDVDESDLSVVTRFRIGDTTVSAGEAQKQPWELWKIAVALGLAVVLIEWWIYNRRVQI